MEIYVFQTMSQDYIRIAGLRDAARVSVRQYARRTIELKNLLTTSLVYIGAASILPQTETQT